MFTLTRCFYEPFFINTNGTQDSFRVDVRDQNSGKNLRFKKKRPSVPSAGFPSPTAARAFIIAAYSGPFSPYSWRQACSRTYLASRKNWSLYLKVSDFHQFRAAFSEDPCNLPGILLLYLKGFQLKVSKGYL